MGKVGSSPASHSGQKRKRGDDAPGGKSPAIQPKAPKGIYEHLPRELLSGRKGAAREGEGQQGRHVPLKTIVNELAGSVSSSVYASKVESKVLVLGGRDGSSKQSWKRTNKQAAPLRGARKAGAGQKESEKGGEEEYGGLLPLNDLWEKHIDRLAATQKATVAGKRSSLANVIKSAELRGAVLKVVKGRCPSLVGLEGIVSKETRGTFELVREDGAARIVPKKGNVFNVVVKGALFSLDGGFMDGRRM